MKKLFILFVLCGFTTQVHSAEESVCEQLTKDFTAKKADMVEDYNRINDFVVWKSGLKACKVQAQAIPSGLDLDETEEYITRNRTVFYSGDPRGGLGTLRLKAAAYNQFDYVLCSCHLAFDDDGQITMEDGQKCKELANVSAQATPTKTKKTYKLKKDFDDPHGEERRRRNREASKDPSDH